MDGRTDSIYRNASLLIRLGSYGTNKRRVYFCVVNGNNRSNKIIVFWPICDGWTDRKKSVKE